jgi:galactonate dehydratase
MKRREMLHFLPLTPLIAASGADRGAASITVTGLEVHRVRVNARGNWILTRIKTSAGVAGIGDASHGGPDDAKLTLLRQFFDLLRGRSIYDIEWLRRAAEPEVLRRGSAAACIPGFGITPTSTAPPKNARPRALLEWLKTR